MKLTVFSAETLPNAKGGGLANKTQVSFSKKGKISFSKLTKDLILLKKGDKVSLAQDDDSPEKWYFYKDKAGYELLQTKTGGLFFCHQELVKTFIDAWDLDGEQTQFFHIAIVPVTTRGDKSNTQYWLLELKGSD